MGNLLSSIFNSFLQVLGLTNKESTIMFIGLDNAGKTTLLHALSHSEVTSFAPTERVNEDQFTLFHTTFKCWDLGGHETVRYLWSDYIPQCSAILFLVDSAEPDRFEEAANELDLILELEQFENVPFAVLFTKIDLPNTQPNEVMLNALKLKYVNYPDRPLRVFRTTIYQPDTYRPVFEWLSSHF